MIQIDNLIDGETNFGQANGDFVNPIGPVKLRWELLSTFFFFFSWCNPSELGAKHQKTLKYNFFIMFYGKLNTRIGKGGPNDLIFVFELLLGGGVSFVRLSFSNGFVCKFVLDMVLGCLLRGGLDSLENWVRDS